MAGRRHGDLAGHSWGGMLAMEHALTESPGLRSLLLCNTRPSLLGSVAEAPEQAPDLHSPEGQEFMRAFMAEHVCRLQPPPDGFLRTAAARKAHPEVFAAMNGPSPFELVGTLRGWDVTPRLGEIQIPTLVVAGAHDLIPPSLAMDLSTWLPRSRMELLTESSHMPFVEEPERFLEIAVEFLDDVESAQMAA